MGAVNRRARPTRLDLVAERPRRRRPEPPVPMRSASAARILLGKNDSSRALAGPTRRRRVQGPPMSPATPTLRKAVLNFATPPSTPGRRRAAQPKPGTGARAVHRRHRDRRHLVQQRGDAEVMLASGTLAGTLPRGGRCLEVSARTERAGPAPVTTSTLIDGSAGDNATSASCASRTIRLVIPFMRSGRSRVRVARPSAVSEPDGLEVGHVRRRSGARGGTSPGGASAEDEVRRQPLGSPAGSRSSSRAQDLAEHRLDLDAGEAAPRQKCGPPPPKATWSLGVRPTSRRSGSANAARSRLAAP